MGSATCSVPAKVAQVRRPRWLARAQGSPHRPLPVAACLLAAPSARCPPTPSSRHVTLSRPAPLQWIYFVSFLVLIVVAWVLRDYGGSALDFSPLNDCLAASSPPNPGCTGRAAVIAIALGSFCFFSLLMVLTLGVTRRDNWRLPIHTGFWPLKCARGAAGCPAGLHALLPAAAPSPPAAERRLPLPPPRRRFLLWAGAIAGFMFVPSTALEGFSQAARVFSGLFILVQVRAGLGWMGGQQRPAARGSRARPPDAFHPSPWPCRPALHHTRPCHPNLSC